MGWSTSCLDCPWEVPDIAEGAKVVTELALGHVRGSPTHMVLIMRPDGTVVRVQEGVFAPGSPAR